MPACVTISPELIAWQPLSASISAHHTSTVITHTEIESFEVHAIRSFHTKLAFFVNKKKCRDINHVNISEQSAWFYPGGCCDSVHLVCNTKQLTEDVTSVKPYKTKIKSF